MRKYKEFSNQEIGFLKVLELSNEKFDSNKTTRLWKCQCKCGNIVYYSARHLNSFIKLNYNVSCGCNQYVNLIGKKFGDLIVVNKTHIKNKVFWECQCECGSIVFKTTRQLNSQKNICKLKLEQNAKIKKAILSIFYGMKDRCYRKNNGSYDNYGKRGIKICDEWLENSNSFYLWALENGYQKGLEIDRIDNNGNYEPSNCRWVTKEINANNKRNNLKIEFNGKIMNLKQWCNELNLPYRKTHKRLYILNWSVEKAFTFDREKEV